jgi:hypothetical protein
MCLGWLKTCEKKSPKHEQQYDNLLVLEIGTLFLMEQKTNNYVLPSFEMLHWILLWLLFQQMFINNLFYTRESNCLPCGASSCKCNLWCGF